MSDEERAADRAHGRRTLSRAKVVDVLDRWGMDYCQTAEAFELPAGWCLRSGSGVSGDSRRWFLWRSRGDGEKTNSVTTVANLVKLLDRAPGLTCRCCKGRKLIGAEWSKWEANYPATGMGIRTTGRLCHRCNGTGVGPRRPFLRTPARFGRRRKHVHG
jgi:hypothetical protein